MQRRPRRPPLRPRARGAQPRDAPAGALPRSRGGASGRRGPCACACAPHLSDTGEGQPRFVIKIVPAWLEQQAPPRARGARSRCSSAWSRAEGTMHAAVGAIMPAHASHIKVRVTGLALSLKALSTMAKLGRDHTLSGAYCARAGAWPHTSGVLQLKHLPLTAT